MDLELKHKERLMGTFQKSLPQANPDEKWVLMERVLS